MLFRSPATVYYLLLPRWMIPPIVLLSASSLPARAKRTQGEGGEDLKGWNRPANMCLPLPHHKGRFLSLQDLPF